ncbi:hypothetical protein ACFYM0_05540 [Streptomyces sp. NPDC006487]|uniref:hypothetical protein n=1 Tax=Streptomyces sp. NPDC006487 TaxID=3364748 RepID=UPI003699FC84
MSETDPHRTSATLELLTFLTGGAAAPPATPAAAPPTAPPGPPVTAPLTTPPGPPVTGRLPPPADREQQLRRRSDLRERLTDGIVELRKRRPWSGPDSCAPEARTPGPEAPW